MTVEVVVAVWVVVTLEVVAIEEAVLVWVMVV